jgi:hypothetical protein
MYKLVADYLDQLPGALGEEQRPGCATHQHGLYTQHSLRATAATDLLDADEDICIHRPPRSVLPALWGEYAARERLEAYALKKLL